MASAETRNLIGEAIRVVHERNPQETDGAWLEDLAVQIGPHIKEWDIARCYLWSEWPERGCVSKVVEIGRRSFSEQRDCGRIRQPRQG